MRSTGEVMGIGDTIGEAYAKALIASGCKLPKMVVSSYLSEIKTNMTFLGLVENFISRLHTCGYTRNI